MAANSLDQFYLELNQQFTPATPFSAATLDVGQPSISNDPEHDTTVLLTGKAGRGYYGSMQVVYNRVQLSAMDPGTGITLAKVGTFTAQEIADGLNGLCNSFLTTDDFTVSTIPSPPSGQTAPVTLTAVATSLGWEGSITINLLNDRPQLSQVIAVRNVDTLYPAGGVRQTPAAWAMMYYMDFSAWRDALLISSQTNTYTNAAILQDLMTRLGFPGWTPTAATDSPTSAVPASNQSFNRVVVQQSTGNPQWNGPMYFHYNTFDA